MSILVTLLGIVISVRLLQSEKQLPYNRETLLGILIDDKPLLINTFLPIDIILDGISTEERDLQLVNILEGIE